MKRELLPRLLMIIGGAMALIFGLLSAFIPGLHYVRVVDFWPRHLGVDIESLPFKLQLHDYTSGMLLCSVGGLLVLIPSLRRDKRLISIGFAGDFLAILGLIFSSPRPPGWFPTSILFETWWLGGCLAIVGICVMFVGLMLQYRGWQRLSILGVPLFLFVLLYPLLIVTKNFHLFFSIFRNWEVQFFFGVLIYIGFCLILLGSIVGFLRFLPNLIQTTHAS